MKKVRDWFKHALDKSPIPRILPRGGGTANAEISFLAYFPAVGVPPMQKSVSPRWGYRECRNQFPRILPRGGGTANAEISSPHTTPRWGYREGRNQCITYFPAVGEPRRQKSAHHILPRGGGTTNAEISAPHTFPKCGYREYRNQFSLVWESRAIKDPSLLSLG